MHIRIKRSPKHSSMPTDVCRPGNFRHDSTTAKFERDYAPNLVQVLQTRDDLNACHIRVCGFKGCKNLRFNGFSEIYRVSHFKLPTRITFLFLNVQQNVSNKSCLTLRGTEDGGKNLTLNSHLKVTWGPIQSCLMEHSIYFYTLL